MSRPSSIERKVNLSRLQIRAEAARTRSSGGFTLLEILAVAVITAMIATLVVNMYFDLSRASERGAERTRLDRHADAVLDHLARDLQETLLITKPPEVDPLQHPWFFIGEEDSLGSRVLFFTRHHKTRGTQPRDWDLTKVAFFMEPDDEGQLTLWRWSRPGIPSEPDFDFPDADAEGIAMSSDMLESFHLEYIGGGAEDWFSTWNSAQLEQSSKIPDAVRVKITISDPGYQGSEPDGDLRSFERIVLLQIPAMDYAHVFHTRNDEELQCSELGEERGEGLVVGDCIDRNNPGYIEHEPLLFAEVPKMGCFYDYIADLQRLDSSIIDTGSRSECRVVMSNWEEDQR